MWLVKKFIIFPGNENAKTFSQPNMTYDPIILVSFPLWWMLCPIKVNCYLWSSQNGVQRVCDAITFDTLIIFICLKLMSYDSLSCMLLLLKHVELAPFLTFIFLVWFLLEGKCNFEWFLFVLFELWFWNIFLQTYWHYVQEWGQL